MIHNFDHKNTCPGGLNLRKRFFWFARCVGVSNLSYEFARCGAGRTDVSRGQYFFACVSEVGCMGVQMFLEGSDLSCAFAKRSVCLANVSRCQ